MQLQRVATETHLAQKLGEKLGLAFAEHSQNTLIKQVHNSTIQNGFKTIIGHFRNSHTRTSCCSPVAAFLGCRLLTMGAQKYRARYDLLPFIFLSTLLKSGSKSAHQRRVDFEGTLLSGNCRTKNETLERALCFTFPFNVTLSKHAPTQQPKRKARAAKLASARSQPGTFKKDKSYSGRYWYIDQKRGLRSCYGRTKLW